MKNGHIIYLKRDETKDPQWEEGVNSTDEFDSEHLEQVLQGFRPARDSWLLQD